MSNDAKVKDIDYSKLSSRILEGHGLITSPEVLRYRKRNFLNKYGKPYYDKEAKEYTFVFMTRPSMNIFDVDEGGHIIGVSSSFARDPKIGALSNQFKNTLKFMDSFVNLPTDTPFIFPLMNQVESIGILDTSLSTVSSAKNMRGLKMEMGVDKSEASQDVSVSMTFSRDRDNSALNMISYWTDIIEGYKEGRIMPRYDIIASRSNQCQIDYGSTIYVFVVGDDFRRIKYWGEYTSAYPKDVNYSTFDGNRVNTEAATATFTTNFYAPMYTPMNPITIARFNQLAMGSPDPVIPDTLVATDAFFPTEFRTTDYYWSDTFAIKYNPDYECYEFIMMNTRLQRDIEEVMTSF